MFRDFNLDSRYLLTGKLLINKYFTRYWLAELEQASREGRTPSLWTAIRKAYWLSYMPGALLLLGATICRYLFIL